MIPSHRDCAMPAEEAASLMLVAGTTPYSGWQRLLPLFERAGCTLPMPALLEEWQVLTRGSAALGQPDVAMLNAGIQQQNLRTASVKLFGACIPPVLLSAEGLAACPEFWLEELPTARLLMFHTRPETALVAAMTENHALDEALAQWIAAAEMLVQTFRRNSCRVALLDVECALSTPVDFLHNCKSWLGLQPQLYSAAPSMPMLERAGNDMQYLIAAQMVAQSPRLAYLIAELEACSLPIGEPARPPVVDCAVLYARQCEEKERRQIIEEERAHILLQLQNLKEDLELEGMSCWVGDHGYEWMVGLFQQLQAERNALLSVCKSQKDRISELEFEKIRLGQVASKVKGKRDLEKIDLMESKERDLLIYQMYKVQEDMEFYFLQTQSSVRRVGILERKLKYKESRVAYMEGSLSWKVTAPLRRIGGIFSSILSRKFDSK